VDQLSALQQAARATPPDGVVVLVDSGIQTVAPLDFRKDDLLEADPAEIRAFLDKNDLLPKLKGMAVLLVGIGNTALPQDRLDQRTQDNLIAIWKAIATGGGASCVETLTEPNTQPAVTAVPAVTTVTPPKLPTPKAVPCQDTVLPDSGAVGFRPGEDNFREPDAAKATLGTMAADINRLKLSVHLVGTTASWGSEAYRLDLAKRRAEAVKRVLVSLGVPADRITTEGVGTHWPTHVPDLDEHGNLIPGPAQRNRSVVARLSCP
jgi:outer membrane protein OmpA-like peptidoglycan-associated protein